MRLKNYLKNNDVNSIPAFNMPISFDHYLCLRDAALDIVNYGLNTYIKPTFFNKSPKQPYSERYDVDSIVISTIDFFENRGVGREYSRYNPTKVVLELIRLSPLLDSKIKAMNGVKKEGDTLTIYKYAIETKKAIRILLNGLSNNIPQYYGDDGILYPTLEIHGTTSRVTYTINRIKSKFKMSTNKRFSKIRTAFEDKLLWMKKGGLEIETIELNNNRIRLDNELKEIEIELKLIELHKMRGTIKDKIRRKYTTAHID